MEKPYSGLTARVLINGVTVGYINGIELKLDKDIAEILQFGAQYKEKLPTIKNWSATADGTVAFAPGESQHKMYQAYESGENITMQIKLDEGVYFEGHALVSSLTISGSPNEAMTINAEFEGNGGVDFVLPETVIVTLSSGVGGTTNPAGVIRVAKNGSLTVTCIPAAGKAANKYYLDGSTSGTNITANTFTLANVSNDTTVYVDWTTA